MSINFEYYRIFVLIAESKSISRAAQALNISQPAVTKELKTLEGLLGVELFNRHARGVTLTTEGSILYENIRDSVKRLEQADFEIAALRNLETGSVRIAFGSFNLLMDFLPLQKNFNKIYPNIEILSSVIPFKSLIAVLKDGKADLAVWSSDPINPEIESSGSFSTPSDTVNIKLAEFEDVCITNKNVSFDPSRNYRLSEFGEYPFLLSWAYSQCYGQMFNRTRAGNPKDIFLGETKSIFSILENNDYLAFVPKLSYRLTWNREQFYRIPLKERLFSTTYWISHKADSVPSVAARAFIKFISEQEVFKD